MNKTTSVSRKTFEKYDAEHILVYFGESEKEMPAMQDSENAQVVYEYDTVLVKGQTATVEAIKEALVAEGFGGYEAEAIAAGVLLQAVQDGQAEGDALTLAKQMVTARIGAYDESTAVNSITIVGKKTWIPRAYREMFADRLAQEQRRGHETLSLDLPDAQPGDEPLTLDVELASLMLDQLNDYATDCYDVTKGHERAVAALTTVKKVLAYDFTTGYPPKLSF